MADLSRPFDDADNHALVDGQMDLDRRATFLRAVSSNPELKARLDGWKAQNEALLSTFGPVLFEPVPVRLMPTHVGPESRAGLDSRASLDSRPVGPIRLRAAAPQAPLVTPGLSAPRRSIAGPLFGIAVVAFLTGALVVFGVADFGFGQHLPARFAMLDAGPTTSERAVALRAYEAHETYATDLIHPVEIAASDESHLLKWIQHRLAMPVRIPDLRPDGWSLLGGRVLPGELGPAAFLLYGNGVERLGLYMARTNAHQTDSFSVYDNGAGLASVAYWTDQPVGFALTTSRDSGWLDRNAPGLVRSIRTQTRDNATAY